MRDRVSKRPHREAANGLGEFRGGVHMSLRTGRPKGLIVRRRAAVSFALAASAVSVVGVSGTSQADTGPGTSTALGAPLAPVVQAATPVTAPVAQAVQPV